MRLAGLHNIMEHKRVELSFFWESHNLILTSPGDLWIIGTRRDEVRTTLVMRVVSVVMSIPLCQTSKVFFPPQKPPLTTTALVTTRSYAHASTHILFPLAWIIFVSFSLSHFPSTLFIGCVSGTNFYFSSSIPTCLSSSSIFTVPLYFVTSLSFWPFTPFTLSFSL